MRTEPIVRTAGVAALLCALVGCGQKGVIGEFEARGLGREPVLLASTFDTAFYAHGTGAETSFVCGNVSPEALLDGTADAAEVLHVEMLWQPKPGATPMDSTATNASIRYILIIDGEVGIYEGGGFVQPKGALGDEVLTITMRDATLRLVEATPGFRDLLSPATLQGELTARHDKSSTRRLHYAVSQYVTNALGRSILVRRD